MLASHDSADALLSILQQSTVGLVRREGPVRIPLIVNGHSGRS